MKNIIRILVVAFLSLWLVGCNSEPKIDNSHLTWQDLANHFGACGLNVHGGNDVSGFAKWVLADSGYNINVENAYVDAWKYTDHEVLKELESDGQVCIGTDCKPITVVGSYMLVHSVDHPYWTQINAAFKTFGADPKG